MNKFLGFLLISTILFGASPYKGSTTAAVTIAGGIIKAKNVENVKKYKRQDCPVCRGKGKYLSGDGIKWVDCGYCEPDNTTISEITHPPIILHPKNCNSPNCKKALTNGQ
jgi:hypothetical protein